MKKVILVALCYAVFDVSAGCSREEGMALLRMAEERTDVIIKTNGSWRVKTAVDKQGRYEFFYSLERGQLRRIKAYCGNGEIHMYDYRGGKLYSSCCVNTNAVTDSEIPPMMMTMYVGDGKSTNGVDKMEFDMVDGKVKGTRLLDVNGSRTTWPKRDPSTLDAEYIPPKGARTKIGPYEWTIVGEYKQGILSRNGKTVLQGDMSLGGKYPWIVGYSLEKKDSANRKELVDKGIVPRDSRDYVDYLFVLDIRTDVVEYIPLDKKDLVRAITGRDYVSYKENRGNFWSFGLSRRGPERTATLEAALKPPAEEK